MRRELHVRFCEGGGVQLPSATRLIMGFQFRDDADRFLRALRERFAKFALELHPDKTRLLEFGRYAAEHRQQRGLGKPETFNFLGFTHICGKQRSGRFTCFGRRCGRGCRRS
jgi:RNA-directed DNA polymerase